MTKRRNTLNRLWPLLACTVLLSACITARTPTTLHTLETGRQQPLSREFAGFDGMILLMPVQLAPHLQGRGLLTRRADGESRASANHLWAGPLDQQIGQQLVASLKDLLATDNVALFPGPRFGVVRYQIEIEIGEFSGNGQSFTAVISHTISDAVNKTILARKTFRQIRPIDKSDHSGYVASASLAIADLSKAVAAELLSARRSQPQPQTRHEN